MNNFSMEKLDVHCLWQLHSRWEDSIISQSLNEVMFGVIHSLPGLYIVRVHFLHLNVASIYSKLLLRHQSLVLLPHLHWGRPGPSGSNLIHSAPPLRELFWSRPIILSGLLVRPVSPGNKTLSIYSSIGAAHDEGWRMCLFLLFAFCLWKLLWNVL